MDGKKRCRKCTKKLPLVNFSKRRQNPDGLEHWCKNCMRFEQMRKMGYVDYSPEVYERKLQEQQGLCAICGKPETATGGKRSPQVRALCWDHNHQTGVGRGLLCVRCNQGLGSFQDDIELLRSAIAYLEHHSSSVA